MAFYEFFLDRDLFSKGKRLNKGTKLEFTTSGNLKYHMNDVVKAAKEKFPEFAQQINSFVFKEKK